MVFPSSRRALARKATQAPALTRETKMSARVRFRALRDSVRSAFVGGLPSPLASLSSGSSSVSGGGPASRFSSPRVDTATQALTAEESADIALNMSPNAVLTGAGREQSM